MKEVRRWRVRIAAHDIEPRFHVPEATRELYVESGRIARVDAVRGWHVELGLPALRSFIRESLRHATVVEVPAEPWENRSGGGRS